MEPTATPMTAAATGAPRATRPDGAPIVPSLRVGYRGSGEWSASPVPTIGWVTRSSVPSWQQAGAELEIRRGESIRHFAVDGPESVALPWPDEPLEPRESARVRVRVRGLASEWSEWSEPIMIRSAALAPGEWDAEAVGTRAESVSPILLRREFELDAPVVGAVIYGTAQGVFQAFVNGREVDDHRLKPGWTSYQWRLTHEATDVTHLLRVGSNAIGIIAAGGWFTERFGFFDAAREFYGHAVRAAALLVIDLDDGRQFRLRTDDSWRVTRSGPIVTSGLYAGESYDARLERPGWSAPGFDDADWEAVSTGAILEPTPRVGPPVRAIEELLPVSVLRSASGRPIVDFGQNLVGHVRLRARGSAGETVTLRHAEVLDGDELAVVPLRAAEATDRYVLAGIGVEEWEPRFTFHGFRYVEVDAPAGVVDPNELVAVVVHSDMVRTGWFETSDPLLSRLHENVVWSMRGNFLSIPTDCPQRDERLGWTGDIQVFAPTASFLYDCSGFLTSWLEDLDLEQRNNGGMPPHVVPDVLGESAPAAGWGDATVIVPTVLAERFGDRSVLERQYGSMRSWIDGVLRLAGDRYLVEDGFQFGDWLDPDAPPELPGQAKADAALVATAYLYRSAVLVSRAAAELGRPDDAATYRRAAERVKEAFLDEYASPSGRLMSDAPTAYALAIVFGLWPDEERRAAMGDRLAFLARAAGYRISTGFLGTPVIAEALAATGHLGVAERIVLQTENPSWLYPVTMGATTVWERWDSLLEDGSINPGGMTSFNHYALGAVADWLHRRVAGLAPLEAGYRRILVAPQPLDRLDFARARFDSPYGEIAIGWSRAGTMVTVNATIPAGATALVRLPGRADEFEVGSGSHEWIVEHPQAVPDRRPLTIESSLAQVIDDPSAYRLVLEAFERHDPEGARLFRRHSRWTPGNVLREALNRAPVAVVSDVLAGFAALEQERGVRE